MDTSIYGKLAGWWWAIQFKDKCEALVWLHEAKRPLCVL
jgi:hypothetical protein